MTLYGVTTCKKVSNPTNRKRLIIMNILGQSEHAIDDFQNSYHSQNFIVIITVGIIVAATTTCINNFFTSQDPVRIQLVLYCIVLLGSSKYDKQ
jgi:hypothetical protein